MRIDVRRAHDLRQVDPVGAIPWLQNYDLTVVIEPDILARLRRELRESRRRVVLALAPYAGCRQRTIHLKQPCLMPATGSWLMLRSAWRGCGQHPSHGDLFLE
jgi:hypothetical protein